MFQQAVATLFKPGEFAASLFAAENNAVNAQIINLHNIKHPEHLPSYWTLSIPGWYDPEMGDIDLEGVAGEDGKLKSWWRNLTQDVYPIKEPVEVFVKHPPFLVFEVDYLLIGEKGQVTPEIKKLQREAMSYAFQAAGFPFACLVDSGGKSIHAYVRLEDDLSVIAQFRESPDFQRLQDLCWVVFGHYDQGVMKQAGRVRLVRTPGALREDGSPQTIIAVGQRVTINGLMQWFHSQLSQEAATEVWSRQTPITVDNSPLRHSYLRISKWRTDLMKDHNKGERGTNWMFVSKTLAMAGCPEPKMMVRPSAQAPLGQWKASWLWHVSAYAFNYFSKGWFFSHSNEDWSNMGERVRWWSAGDRKQHLTEQMKFEGAGDPVKDTLVTQMQQHIANLPPPLPAGPTMHLGGMTGATLAVDPNAPPPTPGAKAKKSKSEGEDYFKAVNDFFAHIPSKHLKKLSSLHSDYWRMFDTKRGIWKNIAPEKVKSWIQHHVYAVGVPSKHIAEVFKAIECHQDILADEEWVEYEHATAFANGTLYIEDGKVDFQPKHNPEDQLCCRIPFNYDPAATCPQWEKFVKWALPDSSRLSLLQEAFGYTLAAGQPFQSFFLFTGVGSNGKSVVISILRQIHQESYEAVPLASLGDKFGLGTIANKRLAVDTEAESAGQGKNGSDMALAQNILKAWTGGDPVKAEAKKVQGWSTKVSAKYFLSANRRPKFMDPSKGVWRRLKLLKFESVVDEKNQIPNLDKILAQEMSGIINWAITGLLRLYAQNGFTTSPVLTADIHEYQNDTDSAFQFFNMFFRSDPNAGWHDIRPVYQAYKSYCAETGCFPVNEAEFRMRMTMKSVVIGQPEDHEVVYGAPFGQTRIPGKQYWAIKNFRCLHPTYLTAQVVGLHPAGAVAPPNMLQGVAR
jgi:P4 family phage/plasmid primase-like protien